MKVSSPPSPASASSAAAANLRRPDDDSSSDVDCGVKRRRLLSPADVEVAINGRPHRKPHPCHRRGADDEPADSVENGHREIAASDERPPSPPPRDDDKKDNYRQTTIIDNSSCNNKDDCMTSAIGNAVKQLVNDGKIAIPISTHTEKNVDCEINKYSHESTKPSSSTEHLDEMTTIDDKNLSEVSADFDCPATVIAKSEISNDDYLSQSPLNLTRSQGSSEGGNKSEDEEYDGYDEKPRFGNIAHEDEHFVNGNNLPSEIPFPWNITSSINNKQKHHLQDDKISAPSPQLLLTSGQLTTGCLQAAQLLIPTARGIMTQTILAIPISDGVPSTISASNANPEQLQQQLLYHMSNNTQQKNSGNRQQLNQNFQSLLPLQQNRYFQHQNTADETTNITCTPDNIHHDSDNYYDANFINYCTTAAADQYNNLQRRKWQSPDQTVRKHHFLSPQQKLLFRAKNGESLEKSNTQHSSKDTSAIQTPTGTIGDCHIYPTNSVASNVTAGTPMSPPALKRNGSVNSGGTAADITQHQSVWPTAITTTDHHDDCNTHKNEETPLRHHSSHGVNPVPPTSSANVNTIKTLVSPTSQLNCNVKQSKEDDATVAYNQQNAICTAFATHMLCASQLAATQQPMYDSMDNSSNAVKKSIYNNNNNNNIKTNNMMGVVNPAALENWMMDKRYYYNNNNNSNSKNIPVVHHQRYNAAAAAAAVAVELLSGNVPASSSGGGGAGGDGLASCKKRKRRTSFTPHALELLNGHFERNTHPSGSEITGLAHRLGYEREVIRIWFCNKRQALKNTVRTINGNGSTHISSKSHTNGY